MKRPVIFETEDRKYYYEDILSTLKKVGVEKGSNIFVHSDLGHFGKLVNIKSKNEFVEFFIRALMQVIEEEGTLIVPTFSYSYCEKEVYNPKESNSTIGILTEYFRKLPGVERSLDPIFSVSALGPKKKYFTQVGTECFGKNSIFDKLYKKDVKIVFIGKTFDITYMHYIEKKFGVKYRFDKKFKGQTKIGSKLKDLVYTYFVRDLDRNVIYDLDKIRDFLDKKKVLKKAGLGYSLITAVTAKDAFMKITEGIKMDPYLLLKGDPNL